MAGCSGEDGNSCTVANNGQGGAVITCEDGTTATIVDGTNGAPGTNCTVTNDGAGTTTIQCADGSTAVIRDGANAPIITPNIPTWVKAQVAAINAGTTTAGANGFPLAAATTDSLRAIPGLDVSILGSWQDPLTFDDSIDGPRFGSNVDFVAFFGDGWNGADNVWQSTESPYFSGSSDTGWVWSNFEYVSFTFGGVPTSGVPPLRMHRALASYLEDRGALPRGDIDDPAYWTPAAVESYALEWHKQVGGGLYRVLRSPTTGMLEIDRGGDNVRFDASSGTLSRITGLSSLSRSTDDSGNALEAGVVPGTQSNCSGGVTPWGTIISAEENVQFFYGDLQDCWTSRQVFLAESVCTPGSNIVWNRAPSTSSDIGSRSTTIARPRDHYGYLVEIDPTAAPDQPYSSQTGVGHMKIGSMGRARWENATFAVTSTGTLADNRPIVIYSGNDRRGGRIYKWVSNGVWRTTYTRAQTRALLESGRTYVAHFADLDNSDNGTAEGGVTINNGQTATQAAPGQGVWILMSKTSGQTPPNAVALGSTSSVGGALSDINYNGIGGFATQDDVLLGLYTAANKLGIRELNRPEDIEWNPSNNRLYVAFTNHGRPNALFDNGVLDARSRSAKEGREEGEASNIRGDSLGAIFTILEDDTSNPGASMGFSFWQVWRGSAGNGMFDASDPDNLMIDRDGGVWFGTDGNFGGNGHADALYYLDEANSRAYRIAAVPSDAEATGPAITPDGNTLFIAVQHPGESRYSGFPQGDAPFGPRSSLVTFTAR